jgi:ribonuclease BN (tRNA processing enzyme)
VDRVVTLSGPDSLRDSYTVHGFEPGEEFAIGPFGVRSVRLPHSVLNAGVRLSAGGKVLSYTGDTGPSPDLVGLARGADLFLAEATYPEQVPGELAGYLSSARQAGEYAAAAGAGRLLLTHLWPGTDPAAAEAAARRSYGGPLAVARMGLVADLDGA